MVARPRVELPAAASKPADAVALRALGLSRRYREGAAELLVFEGLDMTIPSGEMVAIVGESGSGKSTLLHLLSGLDTASAGDVYFGSRSLAAMGDEERAEFRNREIGFVWQQPYLLPEFTARENVMIPLMIAGQPSAAAAPLASLWLQRVGLAQRANHRAGEISGGEQQRVALARALAPQPRFLMADEPTGNLDERTGAAVFALLEQLHAECGLTSVVVTHNRAHAARCSRVIELRDGRLHSAAPPLAPGLPIDPVSHRPRNPQSYV